MSYCHLTSSINFNNGFGLQPGDRIRQVVGNATCFGNCRMTIAISKQDASCGQNNGSATVTATNNTGNLFYAWSNGQTGASLVNAAPGTYHVTVADASGCQVMQVVTIGNSGSALTFSLTPSGTAGLCTSGTLVLSATNNPSYNYVWRKDGNIIVGATASSLSVTTNGNYAVTVTSGSCTGTQSVLVSVVALPAASITAGGPATFCDGDQVQLNASAGSMYSYQWYNNGNPIPGATSPIYNATITGNYTVNVYAGSSCEATSVPFAVTVNPSPSATISAVTATSFCTGGSINLSSSTGTGYSYQWYRNGNAIPDAVASAYSATLGGTYTVVTNAGACSKTSPGTVVTVWPLPVVTVTPPASTIEKFSSQELTATGASVYNWASLPAMVSSTANSGTYRPLTTTTYVVQGTDQNGCKNTANAIIIVIGCGDVTDISATTYSPSRVIIRWKNPEGATTDTLRYRKTGALTWTGVFVTGEEFELNGLEPATEYEYSITPLCNTTTVYISSAARTFRTDALTGGLYIRLYPNPVSSSATLEVIVAANFTLQVSIFDNMGRVVSRLNETENFPAGQVIKKVNAGILANGVYHLSVMINGKKHHIKMVVMR
jgi:hypothetical protein